jgi:hypothetical protein
VITTTRFSTVLALKPTSHLERTVQHPIGEMPTVQLLGMRVTEWTIHGWDLARDLSADDSLDAELTESLYTRLASPGQDARPTRSAAVTWGTTPIMHEHVSTPPQN